MRWNPFKIFFVIEYETAVKWCGVVVAKWNERTIGKKRIPHPFSEYHWSIRRGTFPFQLFDSFPVSTTRHSRYLSPDFNFTIQFRWYHYDYEFILDLIPLQLFSATRLMIFKMLGCWVGISGFFSVAFVAESRPIQCSAFLATRLSHNHLVHFD